MRSRIQSSGATALRGATNALHVPVPYRLLARLPACSIKRVLREVVPASGRARAALDANSERFSAQETPVFASIPPELSAPSASSPKLSANGRQQQQDAALALLASRLAPVLAEQLMDGMRRAAATDRERRLEVELSELRAQLKNAEAGLAQASHARALEELEAAKQHLEVEAAELRAGLAEAMAQAVVEPAANGTRGDRKLQLAAAEEALSMGEHVETVDALAEEAELRAREAEEHMVEAQARERKAEARAEEAEERADEAEERMEEAEERAEDAEERAKEALLRAVEAEGLMEEAEERADGAEARMVEAEGREDKAEARVEEARRCAAAATTQRAATRESRSAGGRTEEAEARAEEAEARAEEAEGASVALLKRATQAGAEVAELQAERSASSARAQEREAKMRQLEDELNGCKCLLNLLNTAQAGVEPGRRAKAAEQRAAEAEARAQASLGRARAADEALASVKERCAVLELQAAAASLKLTVRDLGPVLSAGRAKKGMLVTRGPDWEPRNEDDGGLGGRGEVVGVQKQPDGSRRVWVRWQATGLEKTYWVKGRDEPGVRRLRLARRA